MWAADDVTDTEGLEGRHTIGCFTMNIYCAENMTIIYSEIIIIFYILFINSFCCVT